MTSPAIAPVRQVLHSWKDIALYTGRGVRTIQRYEAELAFPIHRPAGAPRTAVLAFSDEIDRWLAETPMRNPESHSVAVSGTAVSPTKLADLQLQVKAGMDRVLLTQARVERTLALLASLSVELAKSRALREKHLVGARALHTRLVSSPPAN